MTETTLIRTRRDDDLPALAQILERQQAETQYPFHWPLSYPIEQFIHRRDELAAWVAELGGQVVGHVALHRVHDDELGRMWASAHDVEIDRLRCIAVLFADQGLAGRGIGSALLDTATEAALTGGGAPVLDVVSEHDAPVRLYRRRGWHEIGRARPGWLPDHADPVLVMILPHEAPVPAAGPGQP